MFGLRENDILREIRETREDLRQDREAHRQFTAEMTLQLRQIRLESEAHIAELRAHRDDWRAASEEARKEARMRLDDVLAEQRAGRQALLAILDRLPPPPGQATA